MGSPSSHVHHGSQVPDAMAPVGRRTVLIVDDEEGVRSLLARWLEPGDYRVVLATSADAALAVFDEQPPALMLCDIRMPGRDGLWLAARVRQDFPETAIIISSGVQDSRAADECLRQGVVDYLMKPFGRDRLRLAVQRGIEWHEAAGEAACWKRELEAELRDRKHGLLRTVRAMTIENDEDVEALLGVALGGRDEMAHAHRVRSLATDVARALHLSDEEVAVLGRAALIHEIGKAALPLALVRKPAALTADELALVRTYPAIGASMLSEVPFLITAAPIVRDAHERVDGLGFPYGLRGDGVALSARILGVADAYDAMTHPRVFRDAIPPAQALLELDRCGGSQFDEAVVRALLDVVRR